MGNYNDPFRGDPFFLGSQTTFSRQFSIMANELKNDLQESQVVANIYPSGAAVPKAKVGPRCDSPVPGRKMHDSPRQPKPSNLNKLNT